MQAGRQFTFIKGWGPTKTSSIPGTSRSFACQVPATHLTTNSLPHESQLYQLKQDEGTISRHVGHFFLFIFTINNRSEHPQNMLAGSIPHLESSAKYVDQNNLHEQTIVTEDKGASSQVVVERNTNNSTCSFWRQGSSTTEKYMEKRGRELGRLVGAGGA